MNLILFDEHELVDQTLVLSGRRARHICTVLRAAPGDMLQVGMVNGFLGHAQVQSVTKAKAVLSVEEDWGRKAPQPQPAVELILALPRPIMLQRILKQGTVMGVRRFHLIRSRRVEKSFFQSSVLEDDKIQTLLREGMEQAVDTWQPEVHIHRQFKPFMEDVVPDLLDKADSPTCLLAHPTGVTTELQHIFPSKKQKASGAERGETVFLAVGPEGGWNEFEVENFVKQGFTPFTMGERILHVDTALVSLLAQLTLLAQMLETNTARIQK